MPMPKSDRWSDQRRASRQAYDKIHFATVCAKMPAAAADAFRAACAAAGATPSAVLAAYAVEYTRRAAPVPDPETAPADGDGLENI